MKLPSQLLEDAVHELSRLPGIGRKTALRLVLYMLKRDPDEALKLPGALDQMLRNISYCKECHNVSDQPLCGICSNASRDGAQICVVENLRDLMAIEQTQQFNGRYHVLGGVISPVEGVGPESLNLDSLKERLAAFETCELIMALSPTIEGETTIFYISRLLSDIPVTISTIARGVSFGSDLEYTDEVTLARSITARLPYKGTDSGL